MTTEKPHYRIDVSECNDEYGHRWEFHINREEPHSAFGYADTLAECIDQVRVHLIDLKFVAAAK